MRVRSAAMSWRVGPEATSRTSSASSWRPVSMRKPARSGGSRSLSGSSARASRSRASARLASPRTRAAVAAARRRSELRKGARLVDPFEPAFHSVRGQQYLP